MKKKSKKNFWETQSKIALLILVLKKEVAKRAVWLGNDETHYERKWADKDIKDLKKLIDLVLHWIEAEKLTESLILDMPEEKITK